MKIEKGRVVEMHYTLTDDKGTLIDSSKGQAPMPFLQGYGNMIPGLEMALEGLEKGEDIKVSVEPEQAYGVQNPEAIQEIPKSALQDIDDLKVGMELQSQDEQGNAFVVRVKTINQDSIMVDANHPLAGKVLNFEVSIENVRAATEQELEHGHVHNGACEH
jgi:FKBP-type peptidyl-prolyl cis-trans isomerase SlyD